MERIINKLIENNQTISTMESCTGGCLVNELTNIHNSSKVLKFSAITYSNEFKEKMGVSKDTIDNYGVYSIETAKEMSKVISNYANSDYGIGITGTLNDIDPENITTNDNLVYISIYSKDTNNYYTKVLVVNKDTRQNQKYQVIAEVKKILLNLLQIN